LPWLIGSTAVVAAGALAGLQYIAVAGLLGYLVALGWWGRVLIAPLRRRPPREFSPASVLAAVIWWVVALVVTGWIVLVTPVSGWSEATGTLAALWAGGFAAQLLTGALSYLLPSVLGGGPRVVRAGAAWFDRFTTFRLVAINGALVLFLTPTPGWVKLTSGLLGVASVASFLPLMILGIRASIAERKAIAQAGPRTGPPEKLPERESALTANGLLAGVLALTLAVTVGVGIDPSAVGLGGGSSSSSGVNATGRTQRIQVSAREGQRFEPASADVNRGDRVIIELRNDDATMIHDLKLGDATTPRLASGETAELDLGVVGESLEGWCTVVGHRQAGMIFTLRVSGQDATASQSSGTGGHDHAPAQANSAPLNTIVDPVAPAATGETVHRVEMRVTETPLEVAPGVWQKRWTFNGGPVGPTLRGKVGDVFEVTLINDGTIGHSIDFHASNLAPDGPMRTIAPGESLVYRFTARRAGMWLYHCGTAPTSAHIAAGMHGAVIIEPQEGLPQVDREYVAVASEIYLADGTGSSPETAAEVDAAKAQTEEASYSTFNGIAFQYAQRPFTARVGEKVRFWVLAAGPNLATSFHIVGAQFDTVYFEGGYQLKDGRDAFGGSGGGAQALGLEAAQAGFVELTFPEAGHYTVVDHAFMDAEKGALGTVEVTE
jgi:copper-containing nitrite reductase